MNIGLLHFRVGKTDGVSLEMNKWKEILEEALGYNVVFIAGDLGIAEGYKITELSLDYTPIENLTRNAFVEFKDFSSEDEFRVAIEEQVAIIKEKLQEAIEKNQIDLLIINNMFGLPYNIPATIALYQIIIDNEFLQCINHNHDFWFERGLWQRPTRPIVNSYLNKYFPPNHPRIKHVVINSIARNELATKFDIKDAKVIPNFFFFEKEKWKKDEFTADFKKNINVKPNDLIFLQATRIVTRKGIELAIDLIIELNRKENLKKLFEKPLYDGRLFTKENKIVFVLPGLVEDQKYNEILKQRMKENNIEFRYCNEIIASKRVRKPKKYSLFDVYSHADLVTYPSLKEGWGNQFLEAINAKLPIAIFEYPVYNLDIKTFIGKNGKTTTFNTISLGSTIEERDSNGLVKVPQLIIENAAKECISYLQNNNKRINLTSENYENAILFYSQEALTKYLISLLKDINAKNNALK